MKSIFQEAVQHLNSAIKMLSQNKVPFDELEHSQVLCYKESYCMLERNRYGEKCCIGHVVISLPNPPCSCLTNPLAKPVCLCVCYIVLTILRSTWTAAATGAAALSSAIARRVRCLGGRRSPGGLAAPR